MVWKAKKVELQFFYHFWEAQKRCLRHFGGCLGECWLEGCVFQKFFDMLATRWRTTGARWRHHGPKRDYDSAKMGHNSAKMSILSSTWELMVQFWEHFSRILGDGWESEKH